jgi:hypothetical protein
MRHRSCDQGLPGSGRRLVRAWGRHKCATGRARVGLIPVGWGGTGARHYKVVYKEGERWVRVEQGTPRRGEGWTGMGTALQLTLTMGGAALKVVPTRGLAAKVRFQLTAILSITSECHRASCPASPAGSTSACKRFSTRPEMNASCLTGSNTASSSRSAGYGLILRMGLNNLQNFRIEANCQLLRTCTLASILIYRIIIPSYVPIVICPP